MTTPAPTGITVPGPIADLGGITGAAGAAFGNSGLGGAVGDWLGLTKWVRELEVFFLKIGNGYLNTAFFVWTAILGVAMMFFGLLRITTNASVADFASLAALI